MRITTKERRFQELLPTNFVESAMERNSIARHADSLALAADRLNALVADDSTRHLVTVATVIDRKVESLPTVRRMLVDRATALEAERNDHPDHTATIERLAVDAEQARDALEDVKGSIHLLAITAQAELLIIQRRNLSAKARTLAVTAASAARKLTRYCFR